MHIAGNKLQPGIIIGCAAGIGKGYPAKEIELAFIAVQLGNIISLPAEAAGKITQFNILRPVCFACQLHNQGWLVPQVIRNIGKNKSPT